MSSLHKGNKPRSIQLTTIVPVIECSKNEQMPPIVWVSREVNLANKPSFWNFRNVDEECDDNEGVHSNNAWYENLKVWIKKKCFTFKKLNLHWP